PEPLRGRREPRSHAAARAAAARCRGPARDPPHAALLGRLGGADLDSAGWRDAEDRSEDGAARLRPGVSHPGGDRWRVGVRTLALSDSGLVALVRLVAVAIGLCLALASLTVVIPGPVEAQTVKA